MLIPNLLRTRIAANEQSAVSAIRAINVAEQRYRSAFPKIGYACGLANLGGTELFVSPEHAHVLDDSLAGGAKNGSGVPRFSEGGSPETCLEAGLPLPTSR